MDSINLFPDLMYVESKELWLEKTELKLKGLGYRKYHQNLKNEDFAYWKSFSDGDKKIYQIGLFFYDYRKYDINNIGVQFEFMFIDSDNRIDLSVSDNISLEQFEEMGITFYNSMKKYVKK